MQKTRDGKVRRTESEWRELLSRYEASGKPVRAFCREEGLVWSSFQRWRRRLAVSTALEKAPAGFVEVRPAREQEGWSLEVGLPNGCVLRFRG